MAHGICQAFRSCAAYVERGLEALEARMRQRTLQSARKLIKAQKINELELENSPRAGLKLQASSGEQERS